MSNLVLFGIGSAVLSLSALVPYVRGILKGNTKPERAAWWIWLALICLIFAAQWAQGATNALFLTAAFAIGNLIVALLSLKYGYGRFGLRDKIALAVAAAGIYLWHTTHRPLIALIIFIAVDFLGNWLTMAKSWRAPYSENLITWILEVLAAALAVLAVGSLDFSKMLYPAYIVISSGLLAFEIFYRRRWRSKAIKLGKSFNK